MFYENVFLRCTYNPIVIRFSYYISSRNVHEFVVLYYFIILNLFIQNSNIHSWLRILLFGTVLLIYFPFVSLSDTFVVFVYLSLHFSFSSRHKNTKKNDDDPNILS